MCLQRVGVCSGDELVRYCRRFESDTAPAFTTQDERVFGHVQEAEQRPAEDEQEQDEEGDPGAGADLALLLALVAAARAGLCCVAVAEYSVRAGAGRAARLALPTTTSNPSKQAYTPQRQGCLWTYSRMYVPVRYPVSAGILHLLMIVLAPATVAPPGSQAVETYSVGSMPCSVTLQSQAITSNLSRKDRSSAG